MGAVPPPIPDAGPGGSLPPDWFTPLLPGPPNPDAVLRPPSRPAPGFWGEARRRFMRDRAAAAALVVLALMAGAALLAPRLAPWPYARIDLLATDLPPSSVHWFGTDQLGRDLFARTWMGARVSLLIGLAAGVIDLGVGAVYGGVAGYCGGWVDEVLMRVVDVLYGVPFLLVVILLLVLLGPGMGTIILAIALVNWLGMARLARGQVLQLKEQDYVLAARALGAPAWRVIARHLAPNAAGPVLAWLSYSVPAAVFAEAFLSYLGLGVQSPMTSWGQMVSTGAEVFRIYPWQFFIPASALAVALLAFYVVSDALLDALDPRLRR